MKDLDNQYYQQKQQIRDLLNKNNEFLDPTNHTKNSNDSSSDYFPAQTNPINNIGILS